RPSAPRAAIHAARSRSHGNRAASSSGTPARIRATFAGVWNSSASAKSRPVASLIPRATVVLPAPDTPITTTWRVGWRSPVMDGPVLEPVERQVRRHVRELRGGRLVEFDAEAGL